MGEIDVPEKFDRAGAPSSYAIATWRDHDNGGGRQQAREARIDHMRADDPTGNDESPAAAAGSRPTIRSGLAPEFAVASEAVEAVPRDGDPVDRLRDAVAAIEGQNELDTRDDAETIEFVTPRNTTGAPRRPSDSTNRRCRGIRAVQRAPAGRPNDRPSARPEWLERGG